MRLSLSLRQEPRLTQTLSLNARLSLGQKLSLRLRLIEALREESYTASAECPRCGHSLSLDEILKGFTIDPRNYTTKCPKRKCGARFEAVLVQKRAHSSISLVFYCPVQSTAQLTQEMLAHTPKKIAKLMPSVYNSCMVHFGSLKSAFRSIGMEYEFEEVANWQTRVEPFLGLISNVIIAECVGVHTSEVRSLAAAKRAKERAEKKKP